MAKRAVCYLRTPEKRNKKQQHTSTFSGSNLVFQKERQAISRITGCTADVFLEYVQRNLPEGVAMECARPSTSRTLCQIGQLASLSEMLYTSVDICCVFETRLQDSTSVVLPWPIRTISDVPQFTLRVSGDPNTMLRGILGVGFALSPKVEIALLNLIPVNSRLCAVRLSSSIKINAFLCGKRRRAKEAMLSAFITVCQCHLTQLNKHWISSRSADHIAAVKAIPATSDYDGA
ncbi:hypothetical protein T265_13193, partial [Opisthorchis viverrini]